MSLPVKQNNMSVFSHGNMYNSIMQHGPSGLVCGEKICVGFSCALFSCALDQEEPEVCPGVGDEG